MSKAAVTKTTLSNKELNSSFYYLTFASTISTFAITIGFFLVMFLVPLVFPNADGLLFLPFVLSIPFLLWLLLPLLLLYSFVGIIYCFISHRIKTRWLFYANVLIILGFYLLLDVTYPQYLAHPFSFGIY